MQKTIKAILEKQTNEGFFPTYITKKGTINESPKYQIDNIGIHTFVLEKLMQLNPDNPKVRNAFQKGLEYIFQDSISQDGRQVWRWLKNPLKEDWIYPADVDDTVRARTIIEKAKRKGLHVPQEFQGFDYSKFAEEVLTPCGGMLTFAGFKSDNSICPVVNINFLASAIAAGEKISKNPIYQKIRDYIVKTLYTEEFQSSDFTRCSKFYLSPHLLAYLISESKQAFDKATLLKVRDRVQKENGVYLNPLEAALGTSTLINLKGNNESIKRGIEQIRKSIQPNGLWTPQHFYQHQRSGSKFGSSAGTSVFCLEAMVKYDTRTA